tara:strand:+ start:68 stop:2614 length:2547 start_codon:yes stop_codon:yes gene_type:complete
MKKGLVFLVILILCTSLVSAGFFGDAWDFLMYKESPTGQYLGWGSVESPGPDGYMCLEDAECQSGWCDNSYCCTYGEECCNYGSSCSGWNYDDSYNGDTCNDNYYCEPFEKIPNGQSCAGHYSGACESGNCRNDVCCESTKDCCSSDSDCYYDTQVCNSQGYCEYSCEVEQGFCCYYDSDCSGGQECDSATGFCQDALGGLGETCSSDSDCESDYCDHGYCCNEGYGTTTCCNTDSECQSTVGAAWICSSINYWCVEDYSYSADDDDSSDDTTTTSDCASGCPNLYLGDGVCDSACNNLACDYDGGDCGYDSDSYDAETAGCDYGNCPESFIGDGMCDSACNNLACNYDGGDCGSKSNGESCDNNEECISSYCDSGICCDYGEWCCLVDIDCGTEDETCVDYACTLVSTDCAPGCPDYYLADGVCDEACKNSDCGWDEGDCEVTAAEYLGMDTSSTTTTTSAYGDSSNGGACYSNDACASGNCANGVCCESGKTCCQLDAECVAMGNFACDATNNYCYYTGSQEDLDLEKKDFIKDNLKNKVNEGVNAKVKIAVSPYPLPESLTLHLEEEMYFYMVVENFGTVPLNIIYYSVGTTDVWNYSPAVLKDGTSDSDSISQTGKTLNPGDKIESLPFKIYGKSAGETGLAFSVYYSYEGSSGAYENFNVPVTVVGEYLNKHDAASEAFGFDVSDMNEYLGSLEVKKDPGVVTTLYNIYFVKPHDLGDVMKEWNLYASYISYYKEKMVDDVTGAVSPSVVEFYGDVQEMGDGTTYEQTENAALRAVTPNAIKAGWDLGRYTRSVEEIKKEDERIQGLFGNPNFGWANIDGVKTRVMWIETTSGSIYMVKVGAL